MGKIINYKHSSDEIKNTTFELTCVDVGRNSTISCINGELKFKREGENFITFYPIPEVRVLHGTLRFTDNDNPQCFEDKEIYINQKNGLWVYPNENPVKIGGGELKECCKGPILKKCAFFLEWDEWVKCIKVETFNPYVCAYREGKCINICVKTCENLYDVPFYVTGYDKNGDLIASSTVHVDIVHTNKEPDNNSDEYLDKNGNRTCECFKDDYEEENCDTIPDDELDDDLPDDYEDKPELDELECEVKAKVPKIGISYDEASSGNGVKKTIPYAIRSNIENGNLKLGIKKKNDSDYSWSVENDNINGDITGDINLEFEQSVFDDYIPSGGIIDIKISLVTNVDGKEEILCEDSIKVDIASYVPDEPQLKVYPDPDNIPEEDLPNDMEDDGSLPSGKLLFFYDGEAIQNGENCENFIKLDYSKTYTFRVDSGTATWYIYNYDSTKIVCNKTKGDNGETFLTVKLVDYNPLPCITPSEITLKNSSNQYFSFYFAVDEGLVSEDEFRFTWITPEGITTTNPCNDYQCYYQEEVGQDECEECYNATCRNYYYYNETTQKQPFIIESWYALAIDNNSLGKSIHKGGWSVITKGANYEFWKYRTDLEKPTWVKISSYDCSSENTISGDIGCSDTRTQMRIFVGDTDDLPAGTIKHGDVRIISSASFNSSTEVTQTDGTILSKCYVDFIQEISRLTIRLYIIHPAIVRYNIYTDQRGRVVANVN